MTEMADTMALIRDRVDLPVIVDADTGFGNALNAQRTMRIYELSEANALQVEDQTYPKRCGHLKDKSLISTGEMTGNGGCAGLGGDLDHSPHRCGGGRRV